MMRPVMTSRQKLRIGIIIVCVTVVGIYFLYPKTSPSEMTVTLPAKEKIGRRVFIKDFYKYSDDFDTKTQPLVEEVLYVYASNHNTAPDLYTATIREGSLSRSKTIDGSLYTKILIDIHPTNITYILKAKQTPGSTNKPVSVECAPKEQRKDPSVRCIVGRD